MKKICLLFSMLMLGLCLCTSAQDFFGSNFTGKHTWGVNVKYNGGIWVGTHYNIRRFGGFGTRPLDFNIGAEIKIKKGISNIAGEMAIAQVYADGNDFKKSFGLGARYGIRGEFCPISYKDKTASKSPCGSLSLDLAVKPGLYNNAHCVAGNIETEAVKFYFGCSHFEYKKSPKTDSKLDIRFFDRVGVGLHADYTNALKGGGRYHLTANYDHNFILGRDANAAWNTYYDLKDHMPVKADYETGEEGTKVSQIPCDGLERNYEIRMSHSFRF